MRGTVLKQLGRRDEALDEFKRATELNPEMTEAFVSLAQTLQQLGDETGARSARLEAERLTRRKADAQASQFALSTGQERLKKGDRNAAIAQFREAVRLDATNARAHFALAIALSDAGATKEADTHFDEAQRLAPYLVRPEKKR
jgi:Flp pilus assembly protein TadD